MHWNSFLATVAGTLISVPSDSLVNLILRSAVGAAVSFIVSFYVGEWLKRHRKK